MSSGSVGGISKRGLAAASSCARSRVPGSAAAPRSASRTCWSCGQRLAQRLDLARVERGARDQHPCVAAREARADRLGSERGEERAEHAAVLQRAERRHVQLGNPPGQREDAVALAHAELAQRVREAARELGELGVADVARRALAAQEAQRGAARARPVRVPVHRLVRDVQAAARGQTVQRGARLLPREARNRSPRSRPDSAQARPPPSASESARKPWCGSSGAMDVPAERVAPGAARSVWGASPHSRGGSPQRAIDPAAARAR